MIHCSECKAENEPQRDTCHQCEAKLLPDEGIFGKTPLYKRYAKRARRHIILDVQQALADFTKALELVPHTERPPLLKERAALYRELEMREELKQDWEQILTLVPKTERARLLEERAAVYAQLEMNQELIADLEETQSHLTADLESASGKKKQNLAIKLAGIYTSLESVYQKLGMEKEALRTHLDWTYFAEENRHDLFTGTGTEIVAAAVSLLGGDSDAASVGWAHLQVEQMAKDFQNERMKMLSAGQVKAIGYCPKCMQVLVLGPYLQCTLCLNRITPEGRYVMPEEVNSAVQAMRWRLHLPMGSAQHKVVEQPTFSTATLSMGIKDIVARYDRMIIDDHFFFQPNIPEKMMFNALGAFAKDVPPEAVLVLVDNTVFGSAKEGAILTETHLYSHTRNEEPVIVKLSSVQDVSYMKGGLTTNTMLFINGLPSLGAFKRSEEAMRKFALMLKEIATTLQPPANAAASKDATQLKADGTPTIPEEAYRTGIREIMSRYDGLTIDPHFFFQPNIPEKKLSNALGAFAKDVVPEDVLALLDNTVSGSAKEGAILTETHLYAHTRNEKPVIIKLSSIEDASYKKGGLGTEPRLLINGSPFLEMQEPSREATQRFTLMLNEIATTTKARANAAASKDTTRPKADGQPAIPQEASRMGIREIVERYDPTITDNHFFFQPNIPEKKLSNALGAFAKDVLPEDVLVLLDNSAFGSAKEGAILTEARLYAHSMMQRPVSIRLSSIGDASYKKGGLTTDDMLLINGLPFLEGPLPTKEAMQRFTLMLKEIVTTLQPRANVAAPVEAPPSQDSV
jgi:hypothetical protein